MFYTFDDYHARDEYGLGYSVGKCVLGYLPNIVDLCSYLRVLCASTCGTSHDLLQYDLHKIMFSTMERVRCDRHKSNNLIKLKIGLSTTEQNLKRHTTFNIPNLTELRDKRKRGESVTLNVSVDQVLGGNYTISEDSTESLCLSGIHEANGTSSTHEPFTHEPFTHEPFTHEPFTHEPFTHEPFTQTTTEASTHTFYSGTCFRPSQNENNDEVEIGSYLQNIHGENIVKICNTFPKKTKDGPRYVCTCYTQTFFRHSVQNVFFLF